MANTYKCDNCGNEIEAEGTAISQVTEVSEEADCCGNPDYSVA